MAYRERIDLILDVSQAIRDANLTGRQLITIHSLFWQGLTQVEEAERQGTSKQAIQKLEKKALDRLRRSRTLMNYCDDI